MIPLDHTDISPRRAPRKGGQQRRVIAAEERIEVATGPTRSFA
jgi:hypothetical protein